VDALTTGPGAPTARAVGAPARALVAFVLLAYALSWAWVVPLALGHQVVEAGRGWPTHVPALLGPAVAAVVVIAATAGRRGVVDLLRRVVRWRVGWRWWLVAVSPVAYLGVAVVAAWAGGRPLPRSADFGMFSGVPATWGLPAVVLVITFVGALGEDTVGGTLAARGVVAAVVSMPIVVHALALVGLDLWARRTGRLSPLATRARSSPPSC